jgi:hypothetical protein
VYESAVVTALQRFDFDVRAAALRILGSGTSETGKVLDETLSHPKIRQILFCLAHLAWSGLCDYYRGDWELAHWTLSREHLLSDELANAEAELFGYAPPGGDEDIPTVKGTSPMAKARMLINVEGMFENVCCGVKRGDIVDLSDASVERYRQLGYVTTSLKGELPAPFKPAA